MASTLSAVAAPGRVTAQEVPTRTMIGIVEGEILEYLERHGPASVYRLVQALEWPSTLVIMAAGALIREGLAKGQGDLVHLMAGDTAPDWAYLDNA